MQDRVRIHNDQRNYLDRGRKVLPVCELEDCNKTTSEGKPYCTDHINHHPYVSELLERLETRRKQDEVILRRRPRACEVENISAKEIMWYINIHGARTMRRVAHDLHLEFGLVVKYAEILERTKKLHRTSSRRGQTILKPGPAPKKKRTKKKTKK